MGMWARRWGRSEWDALGGQQWQACTAECKEPGEPMDWGAHGQRSLGRLKWLSTHACIKRISDQGLLHCWWILYQLSHQGSPIK